MEISESIDFARAAGDSDYRASIIQPKPEPPSFWTRLAGKTEESAPAKQPEGPPLYIDFAKASVDQGYRASIIQPRPEPPSFLSKLSANLPSRDKDVQELPNQSPLTGSPVQPPADLSATDEAWFLPAEQQSRPDELAININAAAGTLKSMLFGGGDVSERTLTQSYSPTDPEADPNGMEPFGDGAIRSYAGTTTIADLSNPNPAIKTASNEPIPPLQTGLGWLQGLLEKVPNAPFDPAAESRMRAQNPNLMAAGYSLSSLFPQGGNIFSPTERKEFAESGADAQRLQLLGETAGWAAGPGVMRGVGAGAGAVLSKIAKQSPKAARILTGDLGSLFLESKPGKGLTHWWNRLTNRERGLVTQDMARMYRDGMTEGEVLRFLGRKSKTYQEAVGTRAKGEVPASAETPVGVGPRQVKKPIGEAPAKLDEGAAVEVSSSSKPVERPIAESAPKSEVSEPVLKTVPKTILGKEFAETVMREKTASPLAALAKKEKDIRKPPGGDLQSTPKAEVSPSEISSKQAKPGELEYTDSVIDSHHGQTDSVIRAYDKNGNNVGKLQYSDLGGEAEINMIEVPPELRRQGIGTELVRQLHKEYPHSKIKWNTPTEDGSALKKAYETGRERRIAELKGGSHKAKQNNMVPDALSEPSLTGPSESPSRIAESPKNEIVLPKGLVEVDVPKLDRAWASGLNELYIGKGGQGEIPGRKETTRALIDAGKPIEAPLVRVDDQGGVIFRDGRHRFANFRDLGHNRVKLAMDPESKANALKYGLVPEKTFSLIDSTGSKGPINRKIGEAATRAEASPSEAQIKAGNYKKGHVRLHGLDISIENPKGSIRKGTDSSGKTWETPLKAHYGYVRGTKAADGDHVDVFIGDRPESQKVFVVDQMNPKTGKYDEPKVMLGYMTVESAKAGYLGNYEKDWKGLGSISETDINGFKDWLKGGNKVRPFNGAMKKGPIAQGISRRRKLAGSGATTMRGRIRAMGGLNSKTFPGEIKAMSFDVRRSLIRRKGVGFDQAEKTLKEEGWLTPEESLLDILRDTPDVMRRGHLDQDLSEKKNLTEQERRLKEEMERDPEAPPPGKYIEMNAEDLPIGKKLTLLDGKTREGWDVYEVIEKDPFSITLKDGVTVELSPYDRVEVKAADLGKKSTTQPETGASGKGHPEVISEESKAPVKKTEEKYLSAKGEAKSRSVKAPEGTVLYGGIPIHRFGAAAKEMGRIYEKYVGEPIWTYMSDTLPRKAGDKSRVIDAINRGLIVDYKKDPAFVAMRDDTQFKINQAKEKAKALARSLAEFTKPEQARLSQIIQGSVTSTPKRYEKALEAAKEFQRLQDEIFELGFLKDSRFRQLSKKEIADKFREIKEIDGRIGDLKKELKPVITKTRKVSETARTVAKTITEGGPLRTKISKWNTANEARVKEALTSRGYAGGEADTMISGIKESVIPLGEKTTTMKTVTREIRKVIEKTVTKTYGRKLVSRGRAAIVKDIRDAHEKRADILDRIRTHYKMSGKLYLPRLYRSIEEEDKLLSQLLNYVRRRPRMTDKGYTKRRQDLDHNYRKFLGEIKEAPYPVMKGITQESHDVEMFKMFSAVAKNPDWAVTPEAYAKIMSGSQKQIAKYEDFRPLPTSEKLGPLSGAMVDRYIWDDLNEAVRLRSGIVEGYDRVLRAWKTGKVVYNPATQVRNMLSNIVLADWGGLSPHRIDVYAKAAKDMATKSGYWTEVKEQTNLMGTEWAGNEIMQFLKDTAVLKDGNFLEKSGQTIRSLLDLPGKMYQGSEQFFKLALYINERQAGKSVKEAAAHAERHLFNYEKIPPAIRWAKRWYSPFVTFTYMALPRASKTAVKRPWRIARWLILSAAAWEIFRRMSGDSKYQVEKEKKVLPEYMQKEHFPGQLSHLRLPYKDKHGRSKYLDLSYILPWGDVAEQWGQSRIGFRPLLPSHPLYITAAEVATNHVMFTGQDLTDDLDTNWEYAEKLGIHVWRQAVPSLAGGFSFNKLMSAALGEKDWAGRDRDLTEAIFDTMLGIKIRSIDYAEQRARKLKDLKGDIADAKYQFKREYRKITVQAGDPDSAWNKRRMKKLYERLDVKIDKILKEVKEIQ